MTYDFGGALKYYIFLWTKKLTDKRNYNILYSKKKRGCSIPETMVEQKLQDMREKGNEKKNRDDMFPLKK